MRDLAGEFLFSLAICIVGALGLFIWRTHPLIATALVALLAVGMGWAGYRIETVLHPDRGPFRRALLMPAIYALITIGGAFLVWAAYCPCD